MKPYSSRSPLYFKGSAYLSIEYHRMVGYPLISTPSTSLRDPSNSARTILGLEANALAAARQSGAIFLQWPHQGAQNLTRYSLWSPKITSLKLLPTRVNTGPSFFYGTGADFKNILTSPFSTLAIKLRMPSAVRSSGVARYFLLADCMKISTGVSLTLTPRYSENRLK